MHRIIAGVLLLLVSYAALAQTTGYRVVNPSSFPAGTSNGPGASGQSAAVVVPYCGGLYHVAPNATVSGSSPELAAMCRDALAGVELSYVHTGSGLTRWLRNVSGSGQNVSLQCYVGEAGSPNCGGSTSYAMTFNYVYLACNDPQIPSSATTCADPPSDPCEYLTGFPAVGGLTGDVTGEFCRTDDGDGNPIPEAGNCKVVKDGAGISTGTGWFGQVRFTGESCGSGDEIKDNAANCISSSKGTVCVSKKAKNCGTVNGESVCLDSVPTGSCTLLSGGGAVCASSAVVPVDEMDDPIPPDVEVEFTDPEGSSSTYNYYSQTTINNAVGGVSGTSSAAASVDAWQDALAGAGGLEGGEGSSGWGDCDNVIACATDSFLDILADLSSESSLLGVLSGTGAAMGGSSTCPSVTFSVPFMDSEFDILGPVCDFMEPHYGMLALIMQIAWAYLALRVFYVSGRS